MLREHSNLFRRLMIFADIIVISAAFCVGYLFRDRFEGLHDFNFYLGLLPLILSVWIILLYFFGMYSSFRIRRVPEMLYIVFKAAVLGFVLIGSFLYILKFEEISRLFIFYVFCFAAIFLSSLKIGIIMMFHQIRDKGYNFRNILLAGTGKRAKEFMSLVERHPEWGLRIIGLVGYESKMVGKVIDGHQILGTLRDIPDIIHNNIVDELVFVIPGSRLGKLEEIILACETEGVKVTVAVDFYEPLFSRTKLSHFHKFPMITFESTPDQLGSLLFKRFFDIVMSFFGLILLAPLYMMIAMVVKMSSKGPVFFKQERCGLNGRNFQLYKFRTMVSDADKKKKELQALNEMDGPVFKIQNDPRITPIGRYLRKFSLDELPQIWNVLKGDMSLVGPRPPIPSEVSEYDSWHRRRLRMRPGITCLWQVNGRNKITDFNEWAKLDLEYMDNWSLWLDFKILLKTIPVVLFGIGAK